MEPTDPGVRRQLAGLDAVLIDAQDDPFEVVRALHALDPAVQVLLVAPSAEHERLERRRRLARGTGETWIVGPGPDLASAVTRAAAVTRQRRSGTSARRQVHDFLATLGQARSRPVHISDAYLATLLQVLPDPILSIDDADAVRSANPATELMLGRERQAIVGRTLPVLLRPSDPAALEALLESGLRHAASIEIECRPGDEPRILQVSAVPVEAAGTRVRCILLHDLSRERENQALLEAQAAELEAHTAELQARNDEIREYAEEVQRLLGARTRFYTSMSHELRTPINAILGYQDLLLADIYGQLEPAQRTAVERARRAAKHLLELVNDVLDLSKIESGRIQLQPERTELPALLHDLVGTLQPVAQERGVEIRLDLDACPDVMTVDPRRLRQILMNLVSNALKFGRGRPIDLRARSGALDRVVLEVQDRGVGIGPEAIESIFDEFTQIGDEGTGTGLGLPISRQLARLMQGDLTVESQPGIGSTFRLILPRQPAAD